MADTLFKLLLLVKIQK